MILIRDVNF